MTTRSSSAASTTSARWPAVRPLVFVDSAFAATDPTLPSTGPLGART